MEERQWLNLCLPEIHKESLNSSQKKALTHFHYLMNLLRHIQKFFWQENFLTNCEDPIATQVSLDVAKEHALQACSLYAKTRNLTLKDIC